jgi:hypothetical protein
MSRNKLSILVLAPALLLSGCADYLNHYDSMTLAAGDTQNYNLLLQTTDPFNPASRDTRIRSDGERGVAVVRKYQAPQQGENTSQNITVNVGKQN